MKNKKLIVTVLILLLPMLIGLLFYNKLPEQMPIHWDINGNIDAYGDKLIVVILPNILMIFFQVICIFFINNDQKNYQQNQKIINLIYWLIPFVSIFCNTLMYLSILNIKINIINFVGMFLGIIFLILGNYLPKCIINTTIGIRLPWTLNDEKVWNETHRFGGKVWFLSGLLLIILSLINKINGIILLLILLISIIIPLFYSYYFYQKSKVL